MRAAIIAAAARAIFVQWWADQCSCGGNAENCRLEGDGDSDWDPTLDHTPNDPGGVELMDIAPATHPEAIICAGQFIVSVERLNGKTVMELLELCDGPSAEDFGHYLAMCAIGHGVRLSDDWNDLPTIKGPMIGFYGTDVPGNWSVSERLASENIA